MKQLVLMISFYLCFLLASGGFGYAQPDLNWRYWTSDDGFRGSHTRVCNVNWDDTVWLSHSEVPERRGWIDIQYTISRLLISRFQCIEHHKAKSGRRFKRKYI